MWGVIKIPVFAAWLQLCLYKHVIGCEMITGEHTGSWPAGGTCYVASRETAFPFFQRAQWLRVV